MIFYECKKYWFFLLFFFNIGAVASEEALERAKLIIKETKFAPFVNTVVRAPGIKCNLFFLIKDGKKYVIKIMRNNPFLLLREKFCSDFAKRAGLDDAIVPIKGIYGNNKLIISPYCYFNPLLKKHTVSLGDILDYAKERERIIPDPHVGSYKILWSYNVATKEYNVSSLNQFNFEKALVFSFLTLQWDQHRKNILLSMESENPLVIKIKLIDFSNSMTENSMVANKIWPGRVVHPCCLLSERFFKKYLQKLPSSEIKTLIQNLNTINYDDLFVEFDDDYRAIDKADFLHRINDLINAFNLNPDTSIGVIMNDLFKSRYPFSTLCN